MYLIVSIFALPMISDCLSYQVTVTNTGSQDVAVKMDSSLRNCGLTFTVPAGTTQTATGGCSGACFTKFTAYPINSSNALVSQSTFQKSVRSIFEAIVSGGFTAETAQCRDFTIVLSQSGNKWSVQGAQED